MLPFAHELFVFEATSQGRLVCRTGEATSKRGAKPFVYGITGLGGIHLTGAALVRGGWVGLSPDSSGPFTEGYDLAYQSQFRALLQFTCA